MSHKRRLAKIEEMIGGDPKLPSIVVVDEAGIITDDGLGKPELRPWIGKSIDELRQRHPRHHVSAVGGINMRIVLGLDPGIPPPVPLGGVADGNH
jgi:hypothetical protein